MDAYVFKVALSDEPRVWRTVALKETHTLDDLHEIIQEAFEWHGDQLLYAFFMSNRLLWRAPDVYGPPEAELAHESDVPLASFQFEEGKQFLYLFDFDQEWLVDVTFVETAPVEKGMTYPCILDSEGEALPQYAPSDDEDDWEDEDEEDDEDLEEDEGDDWGDEDDDEF